jgi:hypothetical protein
METNAIISELSTVLEKINEEESAANKESNFSVAPGLRFAAAIIESRILDLKIEESTSRDSIPTNVDSNSGTIELPTPANIIAFRDSKGVIDIDVTEEHHFTTYTFDDMKNALMDDCKHYHETGEMPNSAFSDCHPEEPSTDYYVGVKENLDALVVNLEGDNYADKLAYLYDMYKKGEVETIFRVQVEDDLL